MVVVVVGLDPELGPDLLPEIVVGASPGVLYTPWPTG